ncbi:unnamed protein product [Amoebophrya sp. A120]|nr:unnamed protein product [Amoebophrya sp. A120]|eukprot:GSA120T00024198001.1
MVSQKITKQNMISPTTTSKTAAIGSPGDCATNAVLFVGEGNFSFTHSLLRVDENVLQGYFGFVPKTVCASSFDQEEELHEKYPDFRHMQKRMQGRIDLRHGVDAVTLDRVVASLDEDEHTGNYAIKTAAILNAVDGGPRGEEVVILGEDENHRAAPLVDEAVPPTRSDINCENGITEKAKDIVEIRRFDTICWNHPHLGTEDCRLHHFLLCHFFFAAKGRLAGLETMAEEGTLARTSTSREEEELQDETSTETSTPTAISKGDRSSKGLVNSDRPSIQHPPVRKTTNQTHPRVIISLVEGQAHRWRLEEAAAKCGFALHSYSVLDASRFPGYESKRNKSGKSFKNTETKKQWRPGMKKKNSNYVGAAGSSSCEAEEDGVQDQIRRAQKDNSASSRTTASTTEMISYVYRFVLQGEEGEEQPEDSVKLKPGQEMKNDPRTTTTSSSTPTSGRHLLDDIAASSTLSKNDYPVEEKESSSSTRADVVDADATAAAAAARTGKKTMTELFCNDSPSGRPKNHLNETSITEEVVLKNSTVPARREVVVMENKNKNKRGASLGLSNNFSCTHCDRSFRSEQGLRTHVRQVHELKKYDKIIEKLPVVALGNNDIANVDSNVLSTSPALGQEHQFVCKYCPPLCNEDNDDEDPTKTIFKRKTFPNAEALWQHQLAKHTKECFQQMQTRGDGGEGRPQSGAPPAAGVEQLQIDAQQELLSSATTSSSPVEGPLSDPAADTVKNVVLNRYSIASGSHLLRDKYLFFDPDGPPEQEHKSTSFMATNKTRGRNGGGTTGADKATTNSDTTSAICPEAGVEQGDYESGKNTTRSCTGPGAAALGSSIQPSTTSSFRPCEICGQAVPSTWTLDEHLRTLRPLLGLNLECDSCGKSFIEHRALQQHRNYCRLKQRV